MASLPSTEFIYRYDLLEHSLRDDASSTTNSRNTAKSTPTLKSVELEAATSRIATGQGAWLDAFWAPTQRRKHPEFKIEFLENGHSLCISNPTNTITTSPNTSPNSPTNSPTTTIMSLKPPDWKKLLQTALKKIEVEDLGDLQAVDLYASIPLEDSEGRGRQDLMAMEKQLSVQVLFLNDGHVLLIGVRSKLEKKCLVIRNVLSHYYWRLSGKQVSL